jgi:putative hydrolase of the HAD superfamily
MTGLGVELLVLDVHGVVLTNPLMAFLGQLAEATGQSPAEVKTRWRDELRARTWTGQIREDELWRCLAGDFGGQPWRDLLEAQYELGPAAPHMRWWSQRVPIWLLSNHRSDWLMPRLDRFGLTGYFERTIISDVIGAMKPDPAAYRHVTAHVTEPALAMFVDDRSRNVATAASLGLKTVQASTEIPWISLVNSALGLTGTTP